jgi:hypothetical protein
MAPRVAAGAASMSRPSLAALRSRCLKPDPQRLGNWFARRIVRPAALRVTWLILPTGCSAHAVTLMALLAAMGATLLSAQGNAACLALAAVAWHLWYVLDHVDGQVARWRGTATLDGTQLDYLMHHTVNLLLPCGVGWGLFTQSGNSRWLLLAAVWGWGLLLLALQHDARYKAFVQRFKLLHGELRLVGGGGGRPAPPTPMPRHPLRGMIWLARKLCEPPGLLGLLTAAGCLGLCWPRAGTAALQAALIVLGPTSLLLAAADIVRSVRAEACEREFARWFAPAAGQQLSFEKGYYFVRPEEERCSPPARACLPALPAPLPEPKPRSASSAAGTVAASGARWTAASNAHN